ncbi:imidazoleglycerol-phosphate dehydratase 2, chloroplastic isoform X2 [Rosa chinensis]|uniref:imidazoleglycerol-phosphate dehydratase 2, chloroplastic isoform X2 n=1 Tax=Rosa chinensis TaxID=74649 RepID=UPI000D09432D|nr:imidazoleglycerol-phosphate dehydratase 2, chloroplastic isoform X2 [Rosa chinensis]
MEVSAPPGVLTSPSSFSSPPLKPRLLTFANSRWAHLPRKHHHLMLQHMDSHSHRATTPSASNNGPALIISPTDSGKRIGEVKRETKETNVSVKINLDGTGIADSNTGIPFLDHMLDQLASHGLLDVHVRAAGDTHIDDHHTNEDVALAIGTALLQALGDRKGINRFGDFSAPLDEAWIHVSLDLSGRPHLGYDLQIPTERVGTYDTQNHPSCSWWNIFSSLW